MRLLQRVLMVFGLAGLIAGLVRVLCGSGQAPTPGTWRELSGPEFR